MSTTTLPIVTVTEAARRVVLEMRDSEPDGAGLGLRIDVTGVAENGREFAYDLMFEPLADVADVDEVRDGGGIIVVVPSDDVAKLQGATLDHTDTAGLVIRNPNRPEPPRL